MRGTNISHKLKLAKVIFVNDNNLSEIATFVFLKHLLLKPLFLNTLYYYVIDFLKHTFNGLNCMLVTLPSKHYHESSLSNNLFWCSRNYVAKYMPH